MITIGIHSGGPEIDGRPIKQQLRRVGLAVADVRGRWIESDGLSDDLGVPSSGPGFVEGSAAAVNVVFFVSGSIQRYDEVARLQATRLSRRNKLLLVVARVPDDVAVDGDVIGYALATLREACSLAAGTFQKKGLHFDEDAAARLIAAVSTALGRG